ncbi:MAG: KUP/HAK/KT family potassium transporter [Symbiopectobacterium sp.]
MDSYIMLLLVIVLTLLFAIQKYGTSSVGKLFAPVVLIWFLTLAVGSAQYHGYTPQVLQALKPVYAVRFFIEYKLISFFVLGCCCAGDHSGGGALRGYRTFWSIPYSRGMVYRGVSVIGAQLFWSGWRYFCVIRKPSKTLLFASS